MSDNLENYAAADQVSGGFFWASAAGLLVLIRDGLRASCFPLGR